MKNKYYGTSVTTYVVFANSEDEANDLIREFPDGGENVRITDQEFTIEKEELDDEQTMEEEELMV